MSETSLKHLFPIFAHNPAEWTYLDSAATSQKPQIVIERMRTFFERENANVHRATHEKARLATAQYEQARADIAVFIGASSASEIVWTKGATEAINLLSVSLEPLLDSPSRTRILISETEHHANIVPWQQLAARKGMHIDVIPVDDRGVWDVNAGLSKLDTSVAVVAIGHVSNALGNHNPIEPFVARAKEVGALSVIDGAQAVAHMPVDVRALDCDFYVFSGHKVFGPTGIGVLYGKSALLHDMVPYQTGGEMIERVSMREATFLPPPQRFETGTPNIAGVLGLAEAVGFVQQYRETISTVERRLSAYLRKKLAELPGIRLWGDGSRHVATASFTFDGFNHQDIGVLLDKQGIALRVGHHCAMPLMSALGLDGTLRASLGPYNNEEDIDCLCAAIEQALSSIQNAHLTLPEKNAEVERTAGYSDGLGPIAQSIAAAKGWDQVYREVMLAGKALTRQSDICAPEHEVFGCESKVWLKVSTQQNKLVVQVDSPSKIVRGLVAVMLEPVFGESLAFVRNFDVLAYLDAIGLAHHLSESRGNGLRAVWSKVLSSLPPG